LAQISVDYSQILGVNIWVDLKTVMSVKSVFDKFSVRINLIEHHISIGLMAGCKCDDFEGFSHFFQETYGIGPDCKICICVFPILQFDGQNQVMRLIWFLLAVNNGLIDINHQSFFLIIFGLW
jgi:hypothetical protein